MESDWRLCDCLQEEGLGERLVDTLEKTGGSFERHEQFLLAAGHADYVIKCWGKRAWESAARAMNRHDYRYVAEELDHIATIPDGGKAAAQKLADELRDAHPRRTSLDDEIRKVGLWRHRWPAPQSIQEPDAGAGDLSSQQFPKCF